MIFSSVVYFTNPMLQHAWRYLWSELLRKYCDIALNDIQFFEVDPRGMINEFLHLNRIHGRLDTDLFVRTPSFDTVLDYGLQLLSTQGTVVETAITALRAIVKRKYWIFLVDKSLSGHSLSSELDKVFYFRKLIIGVGLDGPKIVILIQIFSDDAKTAIVQRYVTEDVCILYATCCDSTMKINNKIEGSIIKPEGRDDVVKACYWFRDKILRKDEDVFVRMNAASDDADELAFGYRGAALAIADYDNCPTDSVPLLWYDNSDKIQNALEAARSDTVRSPHHHLRMPRLKRTALPYVGPYPRIHSRLKTQSTNPSLEKWVAFTQDFTTKAIVTVMKGLRE